MPLYTVWDQSQCSIPSHENCYHIFNYKVQNKSKTTSSYFVSHWKRTVQSITKVSRPLPSLGCGTRLGSGLAGMRKTQTAVSCTSGPSWFGNISRRLPIAAATCCTRTRWNYTCIETHKFHELIRKHESYTLARNTCHMVYIFMQFLPHLVR